MKEPIREPGPTVRDFDPQEARERCEAATPEPWLAEGGNILTGAKVPLALSMSFANARFVAHARSDLPAALEAIKSMERTVATEFDRAEDAECRLASALEALEETHGRGEVLWRTLEEWLLLQRIFGGSTSEEYIIELEHQLAVARKDTKHWQANHDQQVAFKRVTAEKRDEFKAERDGYKAQSEQRREALEWDRWLIAMLVATEYTQHSEGCPREWDKECECWVAQVFTVAEARAAIDVTPEQAREKEGKR